MKAVLIMGAAALVYAQADSTGYFVGEPSCALPCLSSAFTAAGCQLSDIACQCGPTRSVIANKVGGCILRSCTDPTELGEAINAGQAVCSSFLAGELSFTTPEGPAQTPTPVPGSSSGPGATYTSIIMTNPPTPSSTSGGDGGATETHTGFESLTITPGDTHTDTLIGPSSPILTGSISLASSTPTGAAATPGLLGAGVLAGVVGAVALL
ncbi:hypothetical protein F5Y14DRAFT_450815 [Nemania sp. NC0429]|nr:hypothetical protein F5Y14DRAFT_450815 [Nemania sp. NC0429]